MEGFIPLAEHRVRIQQEVARNLAEVLTGQKELPIAKLQTFRKKEEHRLKIWHRAGGGGKEIAGRRTEIVDILVREIFRFASEKENGGRELPGFLISAFGGYGRRELNPFSDVDITFLHTGNKPTKSMEKIISTCLMALWDLGFKVGHATRSIQGALEHANAEMMTKTAMLESRLLAGDKKLFHEFRNQFEKHCVKGKEKDYITFRMENLKELRTRYGASVFMQEPNIKSGCGGLRDYQNLLWTGMFHSAAYTTKKLVEENILRERERRTLEEAQDFLLRVRTEMHYQTGRPSEQLTLQLQGKVATALGYSEKNILRRCEAFMRDYYRHTRAIHLITSLALGRIREQQGGRLGLLSKLLVRQEVVDDMVIRNGEMFPVARDIFNRDPARMMRAFQLAQIRNLIFSAELEDLVKRRLHLVDRTFQYSKEIRTVFLSIISRKGEVGRILRLMHNLGFLGKYLPEFAPLTCLVQHEFFHRYTADEHTLLCIDKIDALLLTSSPKLQRYGNLFRHFEDPAVLYLAMLLHDTGKAANTRHHEEASALSAQKVARRLQLTPPRKKMLISLVDAHGEISGMARSRNVEDPATVAEMAEIIRDPSTLDALMVITLADGMGTSDEAWSDWKEQMVWSLYHQTRALLTNSAGFNEERHRRRKELQQKVVAALPEDFHEETDAHMKGMPERYFLTKDAAEIYHHLRIFRRFFEEGVNTEGANLLPVVEWVDHPEAGYAEVLVCGWDRERLLERIAAAFLEAGINVLGADIFTRSDNLALDIFKVTNHRNEPLPRERERDLFERKLRELLVAPGNRLVPEPTRPTTVTRNRGNKNEEEELPVWVVVNNNAHPTCTILEVQAPDRLGLLYHLLRAISHGGISIEAARIATEQKAALDVFYLCTKEGKKLEDRQQLLRLERRLRTAATRASGSHAG
jgi:[protein-PII] uridylyltransferase